MLPTLHLLGLTLPVGPLFALLTFFVGSELGARALEAYAGHRENGGSWRHAFGNAAYLGLGTGLVAARFVYALHYMDLYLGQPSLLVSLRPGTLALGPGLAVGAGVGLAYLRVRHRLPVSVALDALAMSAVTGAVVWHTGHFLSGDGYGVPGNVPWALEMWGAARHPVQLYYGLALLGVAVYLWWERQRVAPGQTAWQALLLYGLSELVLSAFRANPITWGPGIRLAQVYALLAVLLAMFVLSYYAGRAPMEHGLDYAGG